MPISLIAEPVFNPVRVNESALSPRPPPFVAGCPADPTHSDWKAEISKHFEFAFLRVLRMLDTFKIFLNHTNF